jgi:hypothetical protein
MRSGIEVAHFEQRQPVPELAEAPCSSRNFARGLVALALVLASSGDNDDMVNDPAVDSLLN